MAAMFSVVEAPPIAPPVHSLLASVGAVPGSNDPGARWLNGYTIDPDECVEASTWSPHCPDPPDPGDIAGEGALKSEAVDNEDLIDFWPFVIEVAVECNSQGFLSRDDQAKALRLLEAATPKALEYEFWTGELDDRNPHLASPEATDISPINAPASAGFALGALITALSGCGGGGRGMIHAPPMLVQAWFADNGILQMSDRLVTRVGHHIVVPGVGYPGTGPDGSMPPEDATWAYATPMVQIRMTDPVVLTPDSRLRLRDSGNVRRVENVMEARAERYASVAFACCDPFAILSSVAGCCGVGNTDEGS